MIFQNSQLDIEAIPQSESIRFEQLLPAYKKLQIIQACIFSFNLSVAAIAFNYFGNFPKFVFPAAIGIIVAWLLLKIVLVLLGFPYKGYAIREHDVHYKTGYINRKVITVPVNRIQHMEIRQGVISRLLGLSKLKLFTAGDSSSDLSLRGISPETAQQLKEMLTAKINKNGQN